MPRADADLQGAANVAERSAPDPIIIDERRIALDALAACAVAGRAIVAEERRAGVERKLKELGIALDCFDRITLSSCAIRS